MTVRKKKDAGIPPTRLDLGCGKHKTSGFIGVDVREGPDVDVVFDLTRSPWPWVDDSVDEIASNYMLSYFTPTQRIVFFNECHRVLKKGGKLVVRVPHWSSMRSIQDPFFQWPPICETTFLAYDKKWRNDNECFYYDEAITADFDFGYGYSIDNDTAVRNDEFKQFAVKHYHNAVLDLYVTLTAKK